MSTFALRVRLARFAADNRGIAAIEMAMITPVALLLLSLASVAMQGFAIQTKVAETARTVTDLVAQAPYVANGVDGATQLAKTALDTDLALGSEIMYPNDAANLKIVVSEISVNAPVAAGQPATGTIVWTEAYNTTSPHKVGDTVTLDATLATAGASFFIYGETSYTYQPLGITMTMGATTLSASEILTPRNATSISIAENE